MQQQRFPRYAIQVPVFLRRLDQEETVQTVIGLTQDLGEGGACLMLEFRLPVGSLLGLVILGEGEVVEAEARVKWVQARDETTCYHGVEFIQLSPTQHEALLKLLAQEDSLRRQSLRLPLTLSVTCQVVGAHAPLMEGETRTISRTGAEIYLPQVLPLETDVELTLHNAPGKRLPGRVRSVEGAGQDSGKIRHGIEFVDGLLASDTFSTLVLSTLTGEDWAKLLRQSGQ
ncbi:MAG: PilZ domain-containing protein [Candidatus Methylomirabilales bacterium]